MKALIAEKERQRTISNGSLDNCIITKDNRLIKIDRIDLRNKSTSYINRLKETLGFSSRSLNRSKNSLIITSPIVKSNSPIVKNNNSMILKVVDSNSRPVTPVLEKKDVPVTPIRSTRRKRDYERRRDSGCGSLDGSPKSTSYDVLPQEDPWEALMKDDNLCDDVEACSSKPANQDACNNRSANQEAGSINQASNQGACCNKPAIYGAASCSQTNETGNLLDPSRIKTLGVGGSCASRLSNHSNALFPPSIVGNGSVMSFPPQYSASVRTILDEFDDENRVPGWCSYIADMFDLSLMRDKAFVLYAFTSFLSMLGKEKLDSRDFCRILKI